MIARAVYGLLLALVLLAPLPLGSNRPWAWSLLALGAAALLGIWALAALINPALHAMPWRRYRIPFLAFVLFLAWALFQIASFSPASWHHPVWQEAAGGLTLPLAGAIGVSPIDSLSGIMRLASYAAIFFLAMQFGQRADRAQMAWWSLGLGMCAYALYGLAEHLSGSDMILWFPKWAYHGSLSATFVNRNHFAIYTGIGLILTLSLIADEVRQTARQGLSTRTGLIYFLDHMRLPLFVLMLMFVVLTTALLLTGSRAGLIASGIGVVSLLGAFALSEGLRSRALLVFGAIILCVTLAILFVSGDAVTARMSELIENAGPRSQVYSLAFAAIAERPLLGHGLGSFSQVFRLMRGEDFGPNEGTYDVAHNSYLEMAVEAGLPAAALLYAALLFILLVFWRGARTRRRGTIYPCVGLAVTVLLAAHALVDFSLQIPAIAATFSLIAGLAYGQSWRQAERRSTSDADSGRQIRE